MFAERNLELWGVVSLLVGGVMLAAGIGAFYGKGWARWTGHRRVCARDHRGVAWAEIQPTQSLIGAVIYVSVVYALATHPTTVEVVR